MAGRYLYYRYGEKVILRGFNKMSVWTDICGFDDDFIANGIVQSVQMNFPLILGMFVITDDNIG